MSFDALAWAAKQRCGNSGAKLVLMGLAECASRNDALAFPSIAELVEFSDLDRKSVIINLARLESLGKITDTGQRCGRTKQIKVYRLCLETVPKTEQFQKRNSTDFSAKSPKNGTRNKSEPVSSEGKPSSQRRAAYPPPPGVSDPVWKDYRSLRDRKKAPMSETAYRRQLAKLQELAEAGFPPGEVVAQSVERGWTGFFPLKADSHERSFEQLFAERFGSNDAGDHAPPDRPNLDEPARSAAMGGGRC